MGLGADGMNNGKDGYIPNTTHHPTFLARSWMARVRPVCPDERLLMQYLCAYAHVCVCAHMDVGWWVCVNPGPFP